MLATVHHRTITIGGAEVFYREAGPAGAPVVVLPHGYPCSSFEFRNFMLHFGGEWRLIAPDFPGSGYSATPEGFAYDFDGFAGFLGELLGELGVDRFVLYLHDFGTWIGLRLAMRDPSRLAGLIIQNGDVYEDTMGPKYAGLREIWTLNREQGIAKLREFVTKEHFKDEFLNDLRPELADLIPPDMWELHWALMNDARREIAARLIYDLKDNLAWFPRYQGFLREHRPPALILWGPQDGYMPEEAGRAYLRDLPDAELHMLDGGHWLLETCLEEAVGLTRDFLRRAHGPDMASAAGEPAKRYLETQA